MATVAEVVELIGGPRDGETFTIGDAGSMPALVVPLPPDERTISITAFAGLLGPYPVTSVEIRTARYRRHAISDVTHRWRYVYDGA